MPNSLLTGVSGLVSHQRLLDVVGHNIANMNTHGYKSQRILFVDSLYEAISPASGGSDGGQGGTNPSQVGGGVTVSQTDRKFTQGSIEHTGDTLDFAISGNGFFTVSDGRSDFFTRAGAFSLDGDGFLVNPQGLYVKRFTNLGEPDGITPGFQIPGDDRIQVPIGAPIQGVKSTMVQVTGNISGNAEPARSQVVKAANPFTTGAATAQGSDLLNSLDTTASPFQSGDAITIKGFTHDGAKVDQSFAVDGSTTLQGLINAIDAAFPGSVATLKDGQLHVESLQAGESKLTVNLGIPSGNQGSISFERHSTDVAVAGKDADQEPSIVTFYDEAGGEHELKLSFVKQSDDEWSLNVIIDPDEGAVVDGTIEPIIFDDSGNLVTTGDPTVTLQINGISEPQPLSFDFGSPGAALRLTHYSSKSSLIPDSDGSPAGVLTGIRVEKDGTVEGVASNGKTFSMAQLAISKFRNNKGLVAESNNLYSASSNSGLAELGTGGAGGRGEISGAQLESSNVDIALEFTKLIVAQRGFSANARTITVSSEVLEELTNIIR